MTELKFVSKIPRLNQSTNYATQQPAQSIQKMPDGTIPCSKRINYQPSLKKATHSATKENPIIHQSLITANKPVVALQNQTNLLHSPNLGNYSEKS